MSVEAKMNKTWAIKWTVLSIAMLVYGGLCVYDGVYKYPLEDAMYHEYERLDKEGRKSEWPELARSKGWSEEQPKTLHDAYDIQTQWYQLAVVWPIGFGALLMVALTSRRKLSADEEGFVATNGRRIAYGDITDILYERWDTKGIAMIVYQDENGKAGQTKIDDWVFQGAEDVLQLIEKHTGISQDASGE